MCLQAIFTAGYKAVLHIHSVVEECEIIELLQEIDQKTRKPLKRKVLFVKSSAVVVVKIQVYRITPLYAVVGSFRSTCQKNDWLVLSVLSTR